MKSPIRGRRLLLLLAAATVLAILTCMILLTINYLQNENSDRENLERLEEEWRNRPQDLDPTSFNPGDLVGRIIIPCIGIDFPVVEMANVDDIQNLNRAPAHLAGTALPGQPGNCVISGHRVTYNHPFLNLDKLKPGDEVILLDTKERRYSYQVDQVFTVDPTDTSILEPTNNPTITLITCHPPHSARFRLVVKGHLVSKLLLNHL